MKLEWVSLMRPYQFSSPISTSHFFIVMNWLLASTMVPLLRSTLDDNSLVMRGPAFWASFNITQWDKELQHPSSPHHYASPFPSAPPLKFYRLGKLLFIRKPMSGNTQHNGNVRHHKRMYRSFGGIGLLEAPWDLPWYETDSVHYIGLHCFEESLYA